MGNLKLGINGKGKTFMRVGCRLVLSFALGFKAPPLMHTPMELIDFVAPSFGKQKWKDRMGKTGEASDKHRQAKGRGNF